MSAERLSTALDPPLVDLQMHSVDQLSADEVRTALRDCGRARAMLASHEAALLRRLRDCEPLASPDDELKAAQGISGRVAKERSDIAWRLRRLPEVQDAHASGDLSEEHVRQIVRAHRSHADAAVAEQATLLTRAGDEGADRFARSISAWIADHDDDGGTRRLDRQRARRKGSSWKRSDGDGMGVISAEFDPVTWSGLNGILGRWTDALWREESPSNRRTPAQRRADAIERIFRFADWAKTRGGSGETAPFDVPAGPPVTMMVIAHYDALTGLLSGETVDGTPIPADELVRLAVDAKVVPAVFDRQSQPLWVGRRARLPNHAQRAAVVARDRRCVAPDCEAPHDWCQIHHVIWWSRGGPTDVDQLALVCSEHHHRIHDDGWILARTPAGGWSLSPP